jgi:hypothetical protein
MQHILGVHFSASLTFRVIVLARHFFPSVLPFFIPLQINTQHTKRNISIVTCIIVCRLVLCVLILVYTNVCPDTTTFCLHTTTTTVSPYTTLAARHQTLFFLGRIFVQHVKHILYYVVTHFLWGTLLLCAWKKYNRYHIRVLWLSLARPGSRRRVGVGVGTSPRLTSPRLTPTPTSDTVNCRSRFDSNQLQRFFFQWLSMKFWINDNPKQTASVFHDGHGESTITGYEPRTWFLTSIQDLIFYKCLHRPFLSPASTWPSLKFLQDLVIDEYPQNLLLDKYLQDLFWRVSTRPSFRQVSYKTYSLPSFQDR